MIGFGTICNLFADVWGFMSRCIGAYGSWTSFNRAEKVQQGDDAVEALKTDQAERQADVNSPKGDALLDDLDEGKA